MNGIITLPIGLGTSGGKITYATASQYVGDATVLNLFKKGTPSVFASYGDSNFSLVIYTGTSLEQKVLASNVTWSFVNGEVRIQRGTRYTTLDFYAFYFE